jgi:hypothetical protein
MTTLVTADLHLTSNPRDSYRHRTLRRLRKWAKKMGVKRTFILGDLTEEKDRHRDQLVNQIVDHVRGFAELGDVIIMQGNHDYASDPDVPFFRFLRHMPQVRWIGTPTAFDAAGIGRVLFLPHTRNYKKEWDGISLAGHALVFAHCTVKRARMGHGRTSTDGIPLSVFAGARVIAGDVHIPHRIGSVRYVGAPYRVDFGDDYKPRVLLLEGANMTSHIVEGPQKRLIEFDGTKDELDALDDLIPGDILKVRVHVTRKMADRWPAFREQVREWAAANEYIVHSIAPVIQEQLGTRVLLTKARVKSDEQVMREFATHRGIDKRMLQHGEKLL